MKTYEEIANKLNEIEFFNQSITENDFYSNMETIVRKKIEHNFKLPFDGYTVITKSLRKNNDFKAGYYRIEIKKSVMSVEGKLIKIDLIINENGKVEYLNVGKKINIPLVDFVRENYDANDYIENLKYI